jgi:hypothetical protein
VNVAPTGGTETISGDDATFEEMRQIARARNIKVNDLTAAGRRTAKGIHFTGSIDNYLHTHQHDKLAKLCGKLGIVQTIVRYEGKAAAVALAQERAKVDNLAPASVGVGRKNSVA